MMEKEAKYGPAYYPEYDEDEEEDYDEEEEPMQSPPPYGWP